MTPGAYDYLSIANPSRAQETALRAYKFNSPLIPYPRACDALNHHLRSGFWTNELPAPLQVMASDLDSVFANTPTLSTAVTVYRGVSTRSFLWPCTKGHRFRALEFWSTAVEPEQTYRFISDEAVLMTLELPVGLAAYNMETLKHVGVTEAELLLPRGILWELQTDLTSMPQAKAREMLGTATGTVGQVTLRPVSTTPRALI